MYSRTTKKFIRDYSISKEEQAAFTFISTLALHTSEEQANNMSTKEDGMTKSHKLSGKNNYFTWLRYFERATRTKDLFELANGSEEQMSEPNQDDYRIFVGTS